MAGAEGQLGDVNETFPFAVQVGSQGGEQRDQHREAGMCKGASPVRASRSGCARVSAPAGSWAIPRLLPLCFWILKTKQRCWPGARREVAPGGLDKMPGGRPTSPRGWPVPEPAVPFPCSAVLRGQEGLHCKAAFQDFLRQPSEQDAAVHQLPGEPAGMLGCPGDSPLLLSKPAPGQAQALWPWIMAWIMAQGRANMEIRAPLAPK